jgi:hypothetical protein
MGMLPPFCPHVQPLRQTAMSELKSSQMEAGVNTLLAAGNTRNTIGWEFPLT